MRVGQNHSQEETESRTEKEACCRWGKAYQVVKETRPRYSRDTYFYCSGDSDFEEMVCDSGDGVNQNKGKGKGSGRGKEKPRGGEVCCMWIEHTPTLQPQRLPFPQNSCQKRRPL